ncbi:MAG: ATP-binding cassette domain-containing protein [Traorella sp.]
MIKIKNVTKKYNNCEILTDINLEIKDGSWTMIIGESGTGKSTLLKMISNQIQYEGTIELKGNIAIVEQENDLLDECSVIENCILNAPTLSHEEVDDLLQKLDLWDVKYKNVSKLSGGEKQRVSIARAILQKPNYLLLDEPSAHQDDQTTHKIIEVLQQANKTMTIILVTHDLSLTEYATDLLEVKNKSITYIKRSSNDISNKEVIKKKFMSNLFLFHEFKSNFSFYINMILSISLCMSILLISVNIGKDFSKNIIHQINDSYEAKQLTFSFRKSIDDDTLNQLLDDYEVYQINYGYEVMNIIDPIIMNGKEIQTYFDETNKVIKNKECFAISSSLADELNINENDMIDLEVQVIIKTEFMKGYRFGGAANLYVPTFKPQKIKVKVGEIIENELPTVYMTQPLLREIKTYSSMKDELKINDFTVTFETKESYEKAKKDLAGILSASIYSLENEINTTERSLAGQFSPFRYVAIFLCVILLVVFIMLYALLKTRREKQIRILKQMQVSKKSLFSLQIKRSLLLFVIIFIFSSIIYYLFSHFINTLFNPLDYTSFNADFLKLLTSFNFTMIDLKSFALFNLNVANYH